MIIIYYYMYTVYLCTHLGPVVLGVCLNPQKQGLWYFLKTALRPILVIRDVYLKKGRPTFQVEKLIMNHLEGLFEMMFFFHRKRILFK